MLRTLFFVTLFTASCVNNTTEDHFKEHNDQRSTEIEEQPVPEKELSIEAQMNNFFQIEPKDERKKNPKIDSLLMTVELAIEEKNLDLLFTVMDEDVISSYGGAEIGMDGIMNTWGEDLNKFWKKLDWIVNLGGFFESDTVYRLPYCDEFGRLPTIPDSIGAPYGYGMCINKDAKLYPFPNLGRGNGITIGYAFSFIDLTFGVNGKMGDVFCINPLGSQMYGYVKASDFYRSSDYSLFIEKNAEAEWKIAAFAPWD